MTKRKLPMDLMKLGDVIARFSDKEPRLGYAADAILEEYYLTRGMVHQIARAWLIELIDEHRHPEAYAENDEAA